MAGQRRGTTLLLLLLFATCARHPRRQQEPAAVAQPGEVRVEARGAVTALTISAGTLSFCDAAGLHGVALPSGHQQGAPVPCPAGGLAPAAGGPEVTVRNPDHGPGDTVEVEGVAASFPIEGHARDWAASQDGAGTVVIVATAAQVLGIDPSSNRVTVLSPTGAERVAAGGRWAAWVNGTTIVARRL